MHLTQGDYDGKAVIVSYVTVKVSKPKVRYGKAEGNHPWVAQGYTTQYEFYNYTSGFIHHVLITNLEVSIIHLTTPYLQTQRTFPLSCISLKELVCALINLNNLDGFLQYNTKYFYKIGTAADGAREFFFTTPPPPGPDTPYTFGAIGEI